MAKNQMNSNRQPAISLEQLLQAIAPQGNQDTLPPVHLWNPAHCGDIAMEIRSDGSWWHEGRRIGRERLVRLFSRILRKDPDGRIYLVTPYEKVIVHVEDAPFLAVRLDRHGPAGPDQCLVFRTNLDEVVLAGADRPLRIELHPETYQPSPYLLVRGGLEARLTRPAFYELANLAVPDPSNPQRYGVWSQGVFFDMGPAV